MSTPEPPLLTSTSKGHLIRVLSGRRIESIARRVILSIRRPRKPVSVRIKPKNFLHQAKHSPIVFPRHGGVAQLGERLTGSQEVRGSIPLVSTTVNAKLPGNRRLFSYAAIAQTNVTPRQHPHRKKLRNLASTSIHKLCFCM